LGIDDHLGIGEIRNGVQRKMDQGVDAGRRGEAGAEQHQQQVARGPGAQAGDHGWPPASENPFSAAFKLLSASIRKFAETTTGSPSATPCRTSIYPEPRRPSLTSRGSKRPCPLSTNTACLLPVSITALSGTDKTGSPLPVSISASTNMSGSSTRSGFGSSTRIRAVPVSLFIS